MSNVASRLGLTPAQLIEVEASLSQASAYGGTASHRFDELLCDQILRHQPITAQASFAVRSCSPSCRKRARHFEYCACLRSVRPMGHHEQTARRDHQPSSV